MIYDLSTPVITREFILSRVTEEDIMEFYTGHAVTEKLFRSPFRKDSRPTAGFFRHKNGSIWYKDFDGSLMGDCFDVVMGAHNLTSLKEVYEKIAHDMVLVQGSKAIPAVRQARLRPRPPAADKSYRTIQIRIRKWREEDKNYWSVYGIGRKTLAIYRVFPVSVAWEDGRVIYADSRDSPCYAYKFEDGYKLYFPMRDDARFRANTACLQGESQLPIHGDLLVITKSLKDVMVLYNMRVPAVAPQGESHMLDEVKMKTLKHRFSKIVVFYDNDDAGKRGAERLSETYSLPSLFLPEHEAKDISDCVKDKGFNYSFELLKRLLDETGFKLGTDPRTGR